ncbi:MAG: DUF4843 domain-containing protein [Mediterranea sp.]|jgi:hypothetical protein|nr:DUF4843 domain-containing protein [Mediterranea sp.]
MKTKNIKRLIYALPWLALGVSSCSHEDLPTYDDVNRVYFKYAGYPTGNLNSDTFRYGVDNMTVNMGYDIPVKPDSIISIPVLLMGHTAPVAREMKVDLIPEESSAVLGEDLEIMPSYIGADTIAGYVNLKIKSSPKSYQGTLLARIRLVPNENFYTDYVIVQADGASKNAVVFNVYFTSTSEAPEFWVDPNTTLQMKQLFGPYGDKKMWAIQQACGIDRNYFNKAPYATALEAFNARFPTTQASAGTIMQINRFLQRWKQEHNGEPLREDNGDEVKMGVNWI